MKSDEAVGESGSDSEGHRYSGPAALPPPAGCVSPRRPISATEAQQQQSQRRQHPQPPRPPPAAVSSCGPSLGVQQPYYRRRTSKAQSYEAMAGYVSGNSPRSSSAIFSLTQNDSRGQAAAKATASYNNNNSINNTAAAAASPASASPPRKRPATTAARSSSSYSPKMKAHSYAAAVPPRAASPRYPNQPISPAALSSIAAAAAGTARSASSAHPFAAAGTGKGGTEAAASPPRSAPSRANPTALTDAERAAAKEAKKAALQSFYRSTLARRQLHRRALEEAAYSNSPPQFPLPSSRRSPRLQTNHVAAAVSASAEAASSSPATADTTAGAGVVALDANTYSLLDGLLAETRPDLVYGGRFLTSLAHIRERVDAKISIARDSPRANRHVAASAAEARRARAEEHRRRDFVQSRVDSAVRRLREEWGAVHLHDYTSEGEGGKGSADHQEKKIRGGGGGDGSSYGPSSAAASSYGAQQQIGGERRRSNDASGNAQSSASCGVPPIPPKACVIGVDEEEETAQQQQQQQHGGGGSSKAERGGGGGGFRGGSGSPFLIQFQPPVPDVTGIQPIYRRRRIAAQNDGNAGLQTKDEQPTTVLKQDGNGTDDDAASAGGATSPTTAAASAVPAPAAAPPAANTNPPSYDLYEDDVPQLPQYAIEKARHDARRLAVAEQEALYGRSAANAQRRNAERREAHAAQFAKVNAERREKVLALVTHHDRVVAAAEAERQRQQHSPLKAEWLKLISFALLQSHFQRRGLKVASYRNLCHHREMMHDWFHRWHDPTLRLLTQRKRRLARAKVFLALIIARMWGGIAVRRRKALLVRQYLEDVRTAGRLQVAVHRHLQCVGRAVGAVRRFLKLRAFSLRLAFLQYQKAERAFVAIKEQELIASDIRRFEEEEIASRSRNARRARAKADEARKSLTPQQLTLFRVDALLSRDRTHYTVAATSGGASCVYAANNGNTSFASGGGGNTNVATANSGANRRSSSSASGGGAAPPPRRRSSAAFGSNNGAAATTLLSPPLPPTSGASGFRFPFGLVAPLLIEAWRRQRRHFLFVEQPRLLTADVAAHNAVMLSRAALPPSEIAKAPPPPPAPKVRPCPRLLPQETIDRIVSIVHSEYEAEALALRRAAAMEAVATNMECNYPMLRDRLFAKHFGGDCLGVAQGPDYRHAFAEMGPLLSLGGGGGSDGSDGPKNTLPQGAPAGADEIRNYTRTRPVMSGGGASSSGRASGRVSGVPPSPSAAGLNSRRRGTGRESGSPQSPSSPSSFAAGPLSPHRSASASPPRSPRSPTRVGGSAAAVGGRR